MDQLNSSPIRLRRQHQQQLISLAEAGRPKEICGVITGQNNTSLEILPIKNISPAPGSNFLMAPEELLKAFHKIEDEHLSQFAFYHSHPHSAPVPSATDLDQAYYPDTPMIIIGRQNSAWQLKAYYLKKTGFTEASIVIMS